MAVGLVVVQFASYLFNKKNDSALYLSYNLYLILIDTCRYMPNVYKFINILYTTINCCINNSVRNDNAI